MRALRAFFSETTSDFRLNLLYYKYGKLYFNLYKAVRVNETAFYRFIEFNCRDYCSTVSSATLFTGSTASDVEFASSFFFFTAVTATAISTPSTTQTTNTTTLNR